MAYAHSLQAHHQQQTQKAHRPPRPNALNNATTVRLRRSRSTGWTLFKVIFAVLSAQTLKVTFYLAYAAAFRFTGDSRLVTALYYLFIPFSEAAQASFLGLLLLLASGFCITRADMGAHKAKVVGIPAILLVTGIVTDVIYYQVRAAAWLSLLGGWVGQIGLAG